MITASGRDVLDIDVDATLSLSYFHDTEVFSFSLKSSFSVLTIFSSPSDDVFNATFNDVDDMPRQTCARDEIVS